MRLRRLCFVFGLLVLAAEDTNQAVSRILVVRRSDDFTLYNLTLRNSPNCHVTTEQTHGFTA